jgi:hypothetical protein
MALSVCVHEWTWRCPQFRLTENACRSEIVTRVSASFNADGKVEGALPRTLWPKCCITRGRRSRLGRLTFPTSWRHPLDRPALGARPDWKAKAEADGFTFHAMYGEPYGDEDTVYAFSLDEIETRTRPDLHAGGVTASAILSRHKCSRSMKNLHHCRRRTTS